MVIREQRIPANDRTRSIDFVCLTETAQQALLQECVAASVREGARERKSERERRKGGGGGG